MSETLEGNDIVDETDVFDKYNLIINHIIYIIINIFQIN